MYLEKSEILKQSCSKLASDKNSTCDFVCSTNRMRVEAIGLATAAAAATTVATVAAQLL